MSILSILLLLPFPYFEVGASSFQFPHSPVSCFYLYSFLLHIFSYNITPPPFRSSYLSVSIAFHVPITTSSSVFLSTWPNHLRLASLIFSLICHTCHFALVSSFLIFSILFMPIIHLNILVSVLSSKFCFVFFLSQFSRK